MSGAPAAAEPAGSSIERYVYYRVREADVAAARAAVFALQAALRHDDPSLEARVLRRPEAREGLQTWMEVYARCGGVSPAQGEAIERCAEAALAGLIAGPRHVETFASLHDAAG